jgi:recombination protein RecA
VRDERSDVRLQAIRICEQPAPTPAPLSTGVAAVDAATRIGGLPAGRIVELYGPESCGKTSLALRAIAAVQASGGTAALLDAEHAFNPQQAVALGVQLETLILSQPSTGEQAMQIARTLAASRAVELIVIDSAAALVPHLELQTNFTFSSPGLHAAVLSRGLRGLSATASRTGACILVLNQMRSGATPDSPPTTSGGYALKSWAAMRIEMRPLAPGGRMGLRVVRNRFATGPGEAEFDLF